MAKPPFDIVGGFVVICTIGAVNADGGLDCDLESVIVVGAGAAEVVCVQGAVSSAGEELLLYQYQFCW